MDTDGEILEVSPKIKDLPFAGIYAWLKQAVDGGSVPYNEADTRANLIDPQLHIAGWSRSQVAREHYYRADYSYTAGRVVLRGDQAGRQAPRRVDYILRYTDSFPIAVVEAKEESKSALSGLQQAKDYARDLGVAFAYATNGHQLVEWDGFTNTTREADRFPSPDELWERWRTNTGLDQPPSIRDFKKRVGELRPIYVASDAATRRKNPLLHPYAPTDATRGKAPRYFQESAIREVLLRVMRGQQRILLTMATGTGKTFTAFQKIHFIRTNVDREGLDIREALEKGAEVFVPEDVQLKSEYTTPQFERAFTLPERTVLMTAHLASLLRRFGPMHKTMVFCVDMNHAQEVARLLNNHFADLGYGDDYAVAIVSEEGAQGQRRLQQFQDSDQKFPVVATTAELLSTGVDVPSARNVVFMKTLNSPILFKQIIGRGTRIDPDTGKLWFWHKAVIPRHR